VIDRIRTLWRGLPQKTRVQLIASVLLVFTGTEVLVLAPYIFDIAVMIDLGGLVVVVTALRSSVSVSIMQLRALATVIMKPLRAVLRAGESVAVFGSAFSPSWYRGYFLFDRIATRCGAALVFGSVGLVLTRAAIEKL
jgi:hypothetical protein